jgi:parallel beta-helix repeat protein
LRVKDGSDPTVRRNRIAGNREGICVTNASGRFIGNSFSGNTKAWDIDKRSADRIVRTGNTEE